MILRKEDWVRWWQLSDLKRPKYIQMPLKILSLLYRVAQYVHRSCSLLFLKKAPLPVISIGSICAGGSGKTPFCAWLYDHLEKAYTTVIVMRGYASRGSNRQEPFWVSDNSCEVGDEAWMLSGQHQTNTPHRKVLISKKRWQGCFRAFQEGYNLALLDDGMQHYQLFRDLEIVLLDPQDVYQGMLPEGRRREPWSALDRADWIVVRSKFALNQELKQELGILHKPYARFSYELSKWRGRHLYETTSSFLAGHKVAVCSGIARPGQFLQLLESSSQIVPLSKHLLADHQKVDRGYLETLENGWKKAGIQYAICTEKDYARWSQVAPLSDFWVYPELSLVWHEGEKELLQFILNRLSSLPRH